MKILSPEQFWVWANGRGLTVNAKYAEAYPRDPTLLGERTDRYWEAGEPAHCRKLFAALLDALGPEVSAVAAWPRFGWASLGSSTHHPSPRIAERLGLAGRSNDALLLSRDEWPRLVDALVALRKAAWCTNDDMFLVPDGGPSRFLMLDHHDAVWVSFASTADAESYVARLERAGFALEDEASDDTFKVTPSGEKTS